MFASYHVPGRKRVYAPSPLSSEMDDVMCQFCSQYNCQGECGWPDARCESYPEILCPESPLPPLAQDVTAMETEEMQLLGECFTPQVAPHPIYSASDLTSSQPPLSLHELDFGNVCADLEQVRRDQEQSRFSENELRRRLGLVEMQVTKLTQQQDVLREAVDLLQKFKEKQMKKVKAVGWSKYHTGEKSAQQSYLQVATLPLKKKAASRSVVLSPQPEKVLRKFQSECDDRQKLDSFYAEVKCTCIVCGKDVKGECNCTER